MTLTTFDFGTSGLDPLRCLSALADTRRCAERTGWMARGICHGDPALTDEFFGDDGPSAAAIACCSACPVRAECATEDLRAWDGAVVESVDDLHGFRGGLLPEERWVLLG